MLSEGLGSGSFDPQAMSMMLDIMNRHGLEVPGAMTVLSRALLTLEGTLRTINPSFNIANEATALLPELAGQQSEMLQQQLEKEVVRALPSLRTLPGHLEAVATQLRSGRLTTRIERFSGHDRAVVDAWIDRATFAAVGVIGLLSAALLLDRGGDRRQDRRRLPVDVAGLRLLRGGRHRGDPDASRGADPAP